MSGPQQPFLSNGNYQKVVGFLRQHYATRMGVSAIPERVDARIQKTVQHYMTEVAKVNGANKPAASLNGDVLRESTTSLDTWIRNQDMGSGTVAGATATRVISNSKVTQPPPFQPPPRIPGMINGAAAAATGGLASMSTKRPAPPTQAAADMSTLFAPPTTPQSFLAPDFGSVIEDEEEDPVVLMKKIQKMREEEMRGSAGATTAPRMEIEESVVDVPQAVPPPIRTVPLPQDYVIPQDTIVKYREKEYNIFITSSDRDWFRNRSENRYNFSVSFNPGNRTGFGLSPSVQERFRNIQRIEFVKSILPTESLATLIRNGNTKASPLYNSDRVLNVLGLPFAGVRIAELNNNGFSTNPREDNTFALVQYDATWNSSVANTIGASANPVKASVGYTAMIPKFLKCQRVYEPTPLATLQKMSLRVERHDGDLLSNDTDVLAIRRICLSDPTNTTAIAATNNSVYAQATGPSTEENPYIFIQTDTYFPYAAVSEGDFLNIQGFVAALGSGTTDASTLTDFSNFINIPGGHYVVGVGSVTGGTLSDGPNAVGYCNVIVIRNRYDDPTTGDVDRSGSYFGGSSAQEDLLEDSLNTMDSVASAAALINMSRQTHFVLRVITRDLDSSSNIRPDNV